MKHIILGTIFALGLTLTAIPHSVFAEETVGEKAEAVGNDAARATKKGYRKAKDATCLKGDAECAAQKAKHGLQGAGETAADKAKEVKNKVD